MNPKADFYFAKDKPWHREISLLRNVALDCNLDETLKWGCPCYTYEGSNIMLIHVFKQYCALLFFKGALLKEHKKLLVQQTKNVQATRQLRFTNTEEITKNKTVIKACIKEAIEIEKAGLTVEMKKTSEFETPNEFKTALDKSAALKKAFETLTPGRQRAYLLYFSSAKQSKTREARVEKFIPKIIKGKGIDD